MLKIFEEKSPKSTFSKEAALSVPNFKMYEHAIIFIEANINTIKHLFLMFLKCTANAETEGLAKISEKNI